MRNKAYIRLFFLTLVVAASLAFFSYSRRASSSDAGDKNSDCENGKCEKKNAQTEFIIWESLSRNLLSASR